MARLLALVIVLTACGDDDSGSGSTFDAAVDTRTDAEGPSCQPSGFCGNSPMCGAGCCGYGEHCDNGECRCGNDPACLPGDFCTSGGPVAPAAAGCGLFCCGTESGVGCPI